MAYCSRCDRFFGTDRALEQHEANSPRHNICSDCEIDFTTETGLIQHFVQSPNHHYCQRCEDHFDDEYDLEEHYREAHYYCETCEKIFNSDIGLHEHNRQKHWYCESCKRVFQNENSLNNHLRSSVHRPRQFACPGRGCGMSFVSEAARVLHFESGTCPSGVNRERLNRFAIQMDRSHVITNPSRLISYDSTSNTSSQLWATERTWNGDAYECFLCHREFRSLSAINAHLHSPAHEDKIYRCPTAWQGCNMQFKTISALFQHVESESCGVHKFHGRMNQAIGSITDGMRRITWG
ncbi:hypothetical protein C8Q75DRAFT_759659 [Abortiporus biennis]|nr:hypothetical protein C8Q75DRAFT_759659 [Abortiporus biennis]